MAALLLKGSTWLYAGETTAPVLNPGCGNSKTGDFWAVLRDDRGKTGPHRLVPCLTPVPAAKGMPPAKA
nr:hypothetical protein [Leisingera sp.]